MCASVNVLVSIIIFGRVPSNMGASVNICASRRGRDLLDSSILRVTVESGRTENYKSNTLPNYRTVDLSTEVRIGRQNYLRRLLSLGAVYRLSCRQGYVATSLRHYAPLRRYVTTSLFHDVTTWHYVIMN